MAKQKINLQKMSMAQLLKRRDKLDNTKGSAQLVWDHILLDQEIKSREKKIKKALKDEKILRLKSIMNKRTEGKLAKQKKSYLKMSLSELREELVELANKKQSPKVIENGIFINDLIKDFKRRTKPAGMNKDSMNKIFGSSFGEHTNLLPKRHKVQVNTMTYDGGKLLKTKTESVYSPLTSLIANILLTNSHHKKIMEYTGMRQTVYFNEEYTPNEIIAIAKHFEKYAANKQPFDKWVTLKMSNCNIVVMSKGIRSLMARQLKQPGIMGANRENLNIKRN